MRKEKRITLIICLLIFGLIPIDLLSQNLESLSVMDRSSRFPITLENEINEIILRDLKPDEVYQIFLVAEDQMCKPSFTRADRLTDLILSFTAESEEQVIEINRSCAFESEIFISVMCMTCMASVSSGAASIIVDENYSPEQLIEDVFIGGDCFDLVEGSISFSGNDLERGYFSGGSTSINIEEGVILSTGNIHNSEGANEIYNEGNTFNAIGIDADLSQMINSTDLYDIAALEFDFTPTTDNISFEFVFASEEYCEYVNSPFNDAFGFFISGPGINGPFGNNAENIAVVPNTTDYSAINSINHLVNTNYYVNNIPATQHADIPANLQCLNYPINQDGAAINDLEFDGFTTVMTAMANVQACETYHIKLVIADVGDGFFDSAVFLKANSFSAGESTVVTAEVPGSDSSDVVIFEGCLDGNFVFTRSSGDFSEPLTVNFSVSPMSTAIAGIDYETLPESIIIPTGDSTFYLPVISFSDAENEGAESIILELESFCSCESPTVTMLIEDISFNADFTSSPESCPGTADGILSVIANGGTGPYAYFWSNGLPHSDSLENLQAGIYNLTITDSNGCSMITQGEVPIGQNVPEVDAGLNGTLDCNTPEITLNGTASTGPNFSYLWTSIDGNILSGETSLTPVVNQPGNYHLNVTDEQTGCTVSDKTEVFINIISPTANADVIGPLILDCYSSTTILDASNSQPADFLNFQWTTTTGNIISGADSVNAEVGAGGFYVLTVTNQNNGCIDVDSINIGVHMLLPQIVLEPIGNLNCNDSVLTIHGENSSFGNDFLFSWNSNDGNFIEGTETLAPSVDQAGTYYLHILNTTNNCENIDSIVVLEDRTPPLAEAGELIEIACNEVSAILDGSASSTGLPYAYLWTTNNGNILNGNSALNPEVDTTGVYVLQVTNNFNGCTSQDSVVVSEDPNQPNSADIEVIKPECFGDLGAIAIPTVYGGVEPYVYSIDGGQNFYNENVFLNLPFGELNLIIQDSDGCQYEEEIFVPEAEEVIVEVVPEIEINLGENYQIEAYVNIPNIDSILWTPDETLTCNDCLDPIATPLQTTAYQILVMDENGCPATAEILLRVRKDRSVYIPNVFSPNADGINDQFLIYAKEGLVENIPSLQVFNRWGAKVFEVKDALPNDPVFGWDGQMKGVVVNPAVFVYVAEIEFVDGQKVIYKGDVTVSK